MRIKHVLRVATVLAAAISAFTLGTPSASATSTADVAFAGTATLTCPGFGYPGVTGNTPDTCPFNFGSGPCADTVVNVNKPGKPANMTGLTCSIGATGIVRGFCGLSVGNGSGGYTDSSGNVVTIKSFVFTGIGQQLVVTGAAAKGGQKGFLAGIVSVIPPTPVLTPAGGSCLAGTATAFTIVGEVAMTVI